MQNYESGMTILYDVVTKSTFIDFRGSFYYLLGPFTTRREAIAAGEAKCRELGWRPEDSKAA
jgi:hypothetical protein